MEGKPPAIPSKMQIQFDNNSLVSRQAGGSGTTRQSDFDTQIRIHIRPGRAGYRRTDRGAREMRRSIVCNALRNDIAPDSPR